MALDFLADATNLVLVGPNGVGKSTLAQNIAHQALIAGHTVLFATAGELLGDLCALDSDSALRRRLRQYASPQLPVIDEVGYLSYSNRYADLMFELISRRYQKTSTLITTNRPFAEWREVFPNAACVVSLIDRLVHNAEIIAPRLRRGRLSKVNPTASRRRANATSSGRATAAAPGRDRSGRAAALAQPAVGNPVRYPGLLDTRGSPRRNRTARRPPRADLRALRCPGARSDPNGTTPAWRHLSRLTPVRRSMPPAPPAAT
jgi:hypothetical protein